MVWTIRGEKPKHFGLVIVTSVTSIIIYINSLKRLHEVED